MVPIREGAQVNDKIVDDAVQAAVVKDYQAGVKLRDIIERHGVSRSAVYWILERASVTPDRVKRGVRLTGDSQEVAQLYELIQAQHARILELEAELRNRPRTK